MKDKELLGSKGPWEVTQVKLECDKVRVDIWVNWSAEQAVCPECGKLCGIYDHREERQ